MMKWLRWVIRIGLGFLAILVVIFAALFIINPSGVALLVLLPIHQLVANTQPPPIAEDQLGGATGQYQPEESSRQLTALLQRKFPTGTSESTLKLALTNEGFKPLPPLPTDCLPPGQRPLLKQRFTFCPTRDQSKALKYDWGSGVCGHTITVYWSTGDRQEVTGLEAIYYAGCL